MKLENTGESMIFTVGTKTFLLTNPLAIFGAVLLMVFGGIIKIFIVIAFVIVCLIAVIILSIPSLILCCCGYRGFITVTTNEVTGGKWIELHVKNAFDKV